MKANQAMHAVSTMCRLLGVAPSGFYAWSGRSRSQRALRDEALTSEIKTIFWWSRGTYGAPRVHQQLKAEGTRTAKKHVARLMQANRLRGASRRKWVTTTSRDRRARPAPDLVNREFKASAPNQLWVADITYIPLVAGALYLAVVLDVFSRRIVGWAMQSHLRTSLVLEALNMAIDARRPKRGLIHHSDQGCQYTSIEFGSRCRLNGIRPSMGSVGDCYDNAMCESFFATLECELLDRHRFRNAQEARAAIFSFIEGWYNRDRRHSSIGYNSPCDFEAAYQAAPNH